MTQDDLQQPAASHKRSKLILILPLALAAGLFVLFFAALQTGDPQKLPSVLVGKKAPEFALAAIPGAPDGDPAYQTFSSAALASGEPSLVNVWASWCAPCIVEHPLLDALASTTGVPIYGINYKDKPEAALRFLARLGNPYRAVGMDDSGRVAIEFGVYGVPETFVVDGEGKIVHRHAGPLSAEVIETEIKPALEKARQQARSASAVSKGSSSYAAFDNP